jgi:hypothetical protein
MSTSELADLETLFMRVLADPMGFIERICEQLAERFEIGSPGSGQPVAAPGQKFSKEFSREHGRELSSESIAIEQLVDRNVLLSAALGACDCWGHDPDCPICAGEGTAGWIQPDRRLYDEYVKPASMRISADEHPACHDSTGEPPGRQPPREGEAE